MSAPQSQGRHTRPATRPGRAVDIARSAKRQDQAESIDRRHHTLPPQSEQGRVGSTPRSSAAEAPVAEALVIVPPPSGSGDVGGTVGTGLSSPLSQPLSRCLSRRKASLRNAILRTVSLSVPATVPATVVSKLDCLAVPFHGSGTDSGTVWFRYEFARGWIAHSGSPPCLPLQAVHRGLGEARFPRYVTHGHSLRRQHCNSRPIRIGQIAHRPTAGAERCLEGLGIVTVKGPIFLEMNFESRALSAW
jgi:hypothetical protein